MKLTATQARFNMLKEDKSKLKEIMNDISYRSRFGKSSTEYYNSMSDSVKQKLEGLGYSVKIKYSLFGKYVLVSWD